MSFNKYSIYSVVSVAETQNADDIQNLLYIADALKEINSAQKAKEYIKSKFDIDKPVFNYPIQNNLTMSITENENSYAINLIFGNENMTYEFAK